MPLRRSWQRPHQIHVHVRELACRHGNGLHGSCWLLVNLAPLTLLARAAHGCHVFAHAFPYKTCRQHPFCSTYAWMCHVMDSVEYGRSVLHWYQGPGDATCHVTQQAGSLYLYSPY